VSKEQVTVVVVMVMVMVVKAIFPFQIAARK
jgi:hypothetical protein